MSFDHTLALRDPRLRRHHAVVVLLFVAPSLDLVHALPVKVGCTAQHLHAHRRDVKLALVLLVTLGYLERVRPAGRGTPGLYRLVAPPQRGASTAPVQAVAA